MRQAAARCGGWTLWAVLGLSGCVLDASVGRVPVTDGGSDAAPAERPVQVLQEQVVGHWCGRASWETGFFSQSIGIRFDQEQTYAAWCTGSCLGGPFPGEPDEADEGRYAITQVTLNDQGWGWSEHQNDDGRTVRVDLEHIDVEDGGSRLHMQRSSASSRLGIPVVVVLELTRCDP